MRKLIGILLLFLVFALISCGPDPVKYNDDLIGSLNSADSEYERFYSMVKQYYNNETGDLSGLSKGARDAAKVMGDRLERMKGLEIPSDGEEFKKASVAYVELIKKSMDGFVAERDKLSKDQLEKAVEQLDAMEGLLDKQNDQIDKVQKAFADKKGFQVIEFQKEGK